MEPLSITAGTIAVLQIAGRAFQYIRDLATSEELQTVRLEVEIYNRILEEVGQIALSSTTSLPESAQLSLQLCKRFVTEIVARIEECYVTKDGRKSKKPKSGAEDRLIETMKKYRRSVKILREVVME